MVDLFPSWDEIANRYPYAPGRGDMSNEEWAQARADAKAKRAALREQEKIQKQVRKEQEKREKDFKQYERDWTKAENEMDSGLITNRDELPNRNLEILRKGIKNRDANLIDLAKYSAAAVENPQNPLELGLSFLSHTGEETGKYLASLFGLGDDESSERTDLNPLVLKYMGGVGGGSGAGAGLGLPQDAGNYAFPDIQLGYNIKAVEDALGNVKKPEYKEQDYDPMNTVADMLMAVDLVNMDFSGVSKAFNDAYNARRKDVADTYNKNENARFETEKWNALQKIALEEMKNKAALQQANLAIQKWQASQPRALGGNKMAWVDSSGNLRFQEIDKQNEARTVGTNAALMQYADLSPKQLKKLTPKQIYKQAVAAAMLYPDKDKTAYINGYMQQANMFLPQPED